MSYLPSGSSWPSVTLWTAVAPWACQSGWLAPDISAAPTDENRAEVVFNREGNPVLARTDVELLKVGEEQAPPGTADMFSHAWYFDDSTETVYTFVSGGIAGFVNRMESVIHLGA